MAQQHDRKYDIASVNCSFKLRPSRFGPSFVFDTQSKRQVIKLANDQGAIEGRGKDSHPSIKLNGIKAFSSTLVLRHLHEHRRAHTNTPALCASPSTDNQKTSACKVHNQRAPVS